MPSTPTLLLAHRGDHRKAPENTLEAFEAALQTGFDGIETDVRLSSAGELLLFHDRVTRTGIPVARLSRQELSACCGYPVPLLEEALDTVPDLLWNIEIKTPAAAVPALPVLARLARTHRLLITSFRHDVVAQAVQHAHLACGLLCAHRPISVASLRAGNCDPDRLQTVVWDAEIVDPDLVQEARAAGFKQAVYGAKTRDEHQAFQALGMDMLITDYPQHVGLQPVGLAKSQGNR